jgi:hypothetical protein
LLRQLQRLPSLRYCLTQLLQAQGHDSNDMPPLETFQPDYSAPGFVGDEAMQYDDSNLEQLEDAPQQPRKRGRQSKAATEAADAQMAAAARAAQLTGAEAAAGGAGAQLLVQQAAAAVEELNDDDLLMGQEEPPGVWDYEAGERCCLRSS